jgi:protein-tyrosine phosphatase
LLRPDEVAEFELQEEETQSRAQGLEFYSFPIPDYGVPGSQADLVELVGRLEAALESGRNVAIHCRQGIGRSSLVAASLLIAAGETANEAFRRIEQARGRPVPDTAEQRDWVARNARRDSALQL